MRRIRLDFVREGGSPAPGALAALVAGALALGAALWNYSAARSEHEALAATVQAQQPAAEAAGPLDEPRRRAREAEAKRAAAVLANLSVPWPALFTALESVAGQGVVLTGLQPEAEARRVRITGEARRFEDIPQYARSLQGTRTFANVVVLAHDTRDGRIGFTLQADWVSAP
jgi:Tfp pilus assembly protein PilN